MPIIVNGTEITGITGIDKVVMSTGETVWERVQAGIDWTQRNSGIASQLWNVAYANGLFVAVGWGGRILTSPDAITWTSRNSGVTNDLYGICYGNNMFVVVGNNGTVLTSP